MFKTNCGSGTVGCKSHIPKAHRLKDPNSLLHKFTDMLVHQHTRSHITMPPFHTLTLYSVIMSTFGGVDSTKITHGQKLTC